MKMKSMLKHKIIMNTKTMLKEKTISKSCNYRFDNKSNLGGVRAADNDPKK